MKATYNLEGDGPLPLSCYETSSALNVAARQASYPNFQPVAIQVSEGMHSWNSNSFNIQSHVFSRVLSITQLTASMKETLAACKAARLFSPYKLHEMRPNAQAIELLISFPFLCSSIPALKEEFLSMLQLQRMSTLHMTLFFFGKSMRAHCQPGDKLHDRCCLSIRHPPHQNVFFHCCATRLVNVNILLYKTTLKLP